MSRSPTDDSTSLDIPAIASSTSSESGEAPRHHSARHLCQQMRQSSRRAHFKIRLFYMRTQDNTPQLRHVSFGLTPNFPGRAEEFIDVTPTTNLQAQLTRYKARLMNEAVSFSTLCTANDKAITALFRQRHLAQMNCAQRILFTLCCCCFPSPSAEQRRIAAYGVLALFAEKAIATKVPEHFKQQAAAEKNARDAARRAAYVGIDQIHITCFRDTRCRADKVDADTTKYTFPTTFKQCTVHLQKNPPPNSILGHPQFVMTLSHNALQQLEYNGKPLSQLLNELLNAQAEANHLAGRILMGDISIEMNNDPSQPGQCENYFHSKRFINLLGKAMQTRIEQPMRPPHNDREDQPTPAAHQLKY